MGGRERGRDVYSPGPNPRPHKRPGGALEQGHTLSVSPLCPVTNCFFHLGFRRRSVNNSCCYQLQGEFTTPVGDPGLVETPCI